MLKKILSFFISFVLIMIFFIIVTVSYYNISLPDNFYVLENQVLDFDSFFEIKASPSNKNVVTSVSASGDKSINLTLKLFNIFPIKDVKVSEIDKVKLIPGGTPFGVKVFTEGLIVVGINDIETESGAKSPARDSGIKTGDIILQVNGNKVSNNKDISDFISKSEGDKLTLLIKRNDNVITTELVPLLSKSDNTYKGGIWVRDSSAGIGTITFHNPTNNVFAGLGHPISDSDTGKTLPLMRGDVVDVNISDIIKGRSGAPGELKGNFVSGISKGTIIANDSTGIYGVMNKNVTGQEPIPMALKQEIKVGDAKILTTIEGNKAKEYDIKIEKLNLNDNKSSKNMIIKITDTELMDKTGGIIQGMSGSPIIQNGKLVGAITHVFVNDPTKGYGIFAENMYKKSKTIYEEDIKLAS